jgi:large subunit ribosomal protein L14e
LPLLKQVMKSSLKLDVQVIELADSEIDLQPGQDRLIPGQIVLIKNGRDAGEYGIIIRLIDERFVLIADGAKRKFDNPRRKNIRHLELTDYVSPEIQRSINETGRATNGKLRFALAAYLNK